MTRAEHSWRLVCHNCGRKFPVNMAMNPAVSCCAKPHLHVHNVEKACERCFDEDHPIPGTEDDNAKTDG